MKQRIFSYTAYTLSLGLFFCMLTAPGRCSAASNKKSTGEWESGQTYPVKDTGFQSIRYEHKSLTLTIERSDRKVYEYYNVPRPVFEKLMNSRFKTGVLGAYIENRYKRKRVNRGLQGAP